jgi:hypothetical protein
MMRKWLPSGLLAVAVALSAPSGAAWAEGSDDLGCSNATLNGDYAFSVLTIVQAPPEGPNVVVGLGTFDGKGGFKQTDFPGNGSTDLSLTAFRTGQTGSYTVNPNCTGFITINLGATVGIVTNAFVISNGGQAVHAVIAAFTALPGGASVTPLQSRIDFWKVASEQDQQQ